MSVQGRHFGFFERGGQNFDRLPRGGEQNIKEQNVVGKNTK